MGEDRTESKRAIYAHEEQAVQYVMDTNYAKAQECFLEGFKTALNSNDSLLIIEAWHHYHTFIKAREQAGDYATDWLDDEAIDLITTVLEANASKTQDCAKLSDTCITALALAIAVTE